MVVATEINTTNSFPQSPNPNFPSISNTTNIDATCSGGVVSLRPSLSITSSYDSEESGAGGNGTGILHKVSLRLFDSLAKLSFSFRKKFCSSDSKGGVGGEIYAPQIGLSTDNFSVVHDVESRNTLLCGSFDLGKLVNIRAVHDVKMQRGLLSMAANLTDSYKLELTSAVPSEGLPKATLSFPLGEVSVEERDDGEDKRALSIRGILKAQLLNGVCAVIYKDNDLNLRYLFKDEHMTFIPSISLPSNSMSFAFKRRFSPSDKLSYWYKLDSDEWSTVYKRTIGKDLKVKTGYDSEVRVGWASLWVGNEDGKVKTVPMKMKLQLMLQVPQDDIRNPALMFRVKKRWEF